VPAASASGGHPSCDPAGHAFALSIVTTLYRSQAYLDRFVAACADAARSAGVNDYEIVCVDDGSPDASVEHLRSLREIHPQIRIIELSRNFGHHHAALAGLLCARGDKVFLIDCDLEVNPRELVMFWRTLEEQKADVVYGYQEMRKGSFVERLAGGWFWRIFNMMSDTRVPENVVTERLMTRRYVDALTSLGDKHLFLAGMMYWAGFVQIGLPIVKRQRSGASTYTFRKRLSLLARAITSFSAVPLYACIWIGLGALAVAMTNAGYVVARKLIHPASTLTGFPTIVALLTTMFGFLMLGLGVVGLYVARIFVQTQGRPLFIIKNIE
jgi:putative glycosyltransferase